MVYTINMSVLQGLNSLNIDVVSSRLYFWKHSVDDRVGCTVRQVQVVADSHIELHQGLIKVVPSCLYLGASQSVKMMSQQTRDIKPTLAQY